MLSERTQEIQELRKQLSDRQQQLVTAEKQSSTTAQEGYLETAELRAQLAEKESIINVSSSGIQYSHSAVKCAQRRGLTRRANKKTPKENKSFILTLNGLFGLLTVLGFLTNFII